MVPRSQRPNAEPTPEEIAAECEAIRAEWTPQQRRLRRLLDEQRPGWTVPEVSLKYFQESDQRL